MTGVRARGEKIRHFIIENVEKHPGNIGSLVARKFNISRQAVNKHIRRLIEEKALSQRGNTRNRTYKLHPIEEWEKGFQIAESLAEDVVWRSEVSQLLASLPDNVFDICHYGFTEMFNNAIDHSDGSKIFVHIVSTATYTEIEISDNGLGIFKKIQLELELLDERHAILELAKGKLTTDPDNHTGEGIFFTSRMFDDFDILSDGVFFTHKFGDPEDWILERDRFATGTTVWMKINNHTSRTSTKVFNQFTSSEDDFGFTKTVVPVALAQYSNDKLVSRSQAKRLLVRIEKFRTVIFDFKDVESIGQAFADEVFRVFAKSHPDIELSYIHANLSVKRMIMRALSNLAS